MTHAANATQGKSFPMLYPDSQLKQMANALRVLAMDAVQKANSGHPGMPMGTADVATALFTHFLKFDPKNPSWPDRDRFILSAGHGSMLLYALNYLTGYEKISLDEIKSFRQLHAKTAGHPEVSPECGIEMTTGPLGQGISTAVGFALAEAVERARYGNEIVDHHTYVIASDGDLMEGISHEACSLAGHMKLGRLIVLYDQNGITIDGSTALSFTENVAARFESYGWDVQTVDGHDISALCSAIAEAKGSDLPSLICCRTTIGFGSPSKAGKSSCHGSPLGADEIEATRKVLGWSHPPFEIPKDILSDWRTVGEKGQALHSAWEKRFTKALHKEEFEQSHKQNVRDAITETIQTLKENFAQERPKMATRQTSGECLEHLVLTLPQLVGGSADLTGSNNTKTKSSVVISPEDYSGNYINYGVREHGMAAVMNGMALHGGIIPYAGTFLQFADYARPAIRLAALMKQRVIHIMTHDSIGLGEDGPTHQPVEHLAALRAIPNCYVFRRCDGVETAECWELALGLETAPSIMALSRQALPTLRGAAKSDLSENKSAKGAYILKDSEEAPAVTLFATGSEVEIAMDAAKIIGERARVVSVPCLDLFLEQKEEYIESLAGGENCIKVAVEAAIRQGWDAVIGRKGIFVGMKGFGESAPAPLLYKHFGITAQAIVDSVKKVERDTKK